jgi:CheY-like chemotaxis protein
MAKVLIVEDDEVLRDLYREIFEREEYSVETAINGEDGMEKIKSFKPDIVLLDIVMPKMSGFDVLRKLRDDESTKGIPVIVLTNIYADSQDLVQNMGVSFVLLKSDCTPGQIIEKARVVLN